MRNKLKKHAPTILTTMGGVGVISTAVMAAKATPKAMRLLEQAKNDKGEELTKFEKVKVAGPVYIPTAVMGTTTLICIFGANALNKRNQAALSSAYALVNNSYKEYKKKVKELYGEEGEELVVHEIAKDKYDGQKPNEGAELFYDEFSGRFFTSTMEDVLKAENLVNRDLVMQDWATVNDFYGYLKIPEIDGGDIIGWSSPMNEQMYWQTWVDFSHSKMVDDDCLEYYILRMFQQPMPDFEDFIN